MRRFLKQAHARRRQRRLRAPFCWFYLFPALILAWHVTLATPAMAQADQGLVQSDASYAFGQSMRFTLRAKSTQVIEEVTLFFNTPDMEQTYAVNVELSPAKEIDLVHEVSLTQVQLAPFVTVRYWWRLSTRDGSIMVEEKTVAYVDDRFSWHSAQREGIDVHWTGDEGDLGQVALDVIARSQPKLALLFPGDVAPLSVYIYPSMADLRSALRLTGRDWLGADAMPELGVVLVTAVNPRTAAFDLGKSIPHELSHLLLFRSLGPAYDNAPRWLDEGLATSFESTPDVGYRQTLDAAIANQTTIPLTSLCASFPGDDAGTRLAYAESASLVTFIRQQYGTEALRGLVDAYADGADCGSGVERVLNLSLVELEADWLRSEAPRPPLAQFLDANGLWVVLAGGGFVLMAMLLFPMKRSRRRPQFSEEG